MIRGVYTFCIVTCPNAQLSFSGCTIWPCSRISSHLGILPPRFSSSALQKLIRALQARWSLPVSSRGSFRASHALMPSRTSRRHNLGLDVETIPFLRHGLIARILGSCVIFYLIRRRGSRVLTDTERIELLSKHLIYSRIPSMASLDWKMHLSIWACESVSHCHVKRSLWMPRLRGTKEEPGRCAVRRCAGLSNSFQQREDRYWDR
jgi:hypothetical protein